MFSVTGSSMISSGFSSNGKTLSLTLESSVIGLKVTSLMYTSSSRSSEVISTCSLLETSSTTATANFLTVKLFSSEVTTFPEL